MVETATQPDPGTPKYKEWFENQILQEKERSDRIDKVGISPVSPFSPVSPLLHAKDTGESSLLNPIIEFDTVTPIHTVTRPRINNGTFNGTEPVHSICLAKEVPEYPPYIILDDTNKVNKTERKISARIITDKNKISEHLLGVPPKTKIRLEKVLQLHGIFVPKEGDKDEQGFNLVEELAKSNLCLQPIQKLRDPALLEKIDWKPYVQTQVQWEFEKDQRLVLAQKAHLLKGHNPRLNPHSIQVTLSGTGKTSHYATNAEVYDKVTKNSFLGFAKSPEEVYPGTLNGSCLPIAIDQIESGEWGIMGYLFNIMESGKARISSGSVDFTVKSTSPLAFLANPEDTDNPEKSFGSLLKHLTENPAAGRRFGIIVYSLDYTQFKGRSSHFSMEEWRLSAQLFRAVEEYAEPELEKIYRDQRIWEYISLPIPTYYNNIKKITKSLSNPTVKSFLHEHGKAGQSRVRAAGLSIAIADHLDKIALRNYDLDEILEYANDTLTDIVNINLESIGNLIENLSSDLRISAKYAYERQDEYIRIIIEAVEYARKNKIAADSFPLKDIDYAPESETYTHLSKAVYKYEHKKTGKTLLNNTFKQCFGFKLEPSEQGPVVHLSQGFEISLTFLHKAWRSGETGENGENLPLTLKEKHDTIRDIIPVEYAMSKDTIKATALLQGISHDETEKTLSSLESTRIIKQTKPGFYTFIVTKADIGEYRAIEGLHQKMKGILENLSALPNNASNEEMFAVWGDELGIKNIEEFEKITDILLKECTLYVDPEGAMGVS